LLRCKVCKGFLLKCSLGEFRNRIGNVLRRRRRIRVRGKESAEAALRTASKAAYDSLWASFDLGIIPIQDVLAARTSLAQAMALRLPPTRPLQRPSPTSADGFDFGKNEPFYRRRMLAQLNRGESRHRLARKCTIYFGSSS
jgi:hypothetical protein